MALSYRNAGGEVELPGHFDNPHPAYQPEGQGMQRLLSSFGSKPASHAVHDGLPAMATEPVTQDTQISVLWSGDGHVPFSHGKQLVPLTGT